MYVSRGGTEGERGVGGRVDGLEISHPVTRVIKQRLGVCPPGTDPLSGGVVCRVDDDGFATASGWSIAVSICYRIQAVVKFRFSGVTRGGSRAVASGIVRLGVRAVHSACSCSTSVRRKRVGVAIA